VYTEKPIKVAPGWAALTILLTLLALVSWALVTRIMAGQVFAAIALGVVGLVLVACLFGLFIVNPNEARVVQLFGRYIGTAKEPGLRWANPLYSKAHVSQRVRNFESSRIKVNELEGNPIEIAAVVVWKVVDSAEALFEVKDYENYVHVQSESALRNLSTSYPYDTHMADQMSLRGNTAEIAEHLKTEIQSRLDRAGVAVIEARISHLAYAPEIASAMLQRQQAGAIIAARQRIVEGAVGMVEMALALLSKNRIVELDEERKAQMVSNLLVVLCSDRATQPVVNAGTMHP